MGENIKFALSEIDTKGVAYFELLVAKGEVVPCAELAKVLMKHSRSEDIKREVRRKFTAMLSERYSAILGDGDVLAGMHAKLVNIYMNRVHKKLDISRDIPIFSDLAGRYIDEGVTLLHYDRLYTLFQAVQSAVTHEGDIIELGVYRGGSLKFISEVIQLSGKARRLVGFDTFAGHAAVSDEDGAVHYAGMFKTGGVEEIAAYVADPKIELVVGDASVTFAEYARSSSGISLAHLDMDLYQPTADTLPLAWELLAPGGMILLDDYGFTSCPGVKQAVDEFLPRVQSTHLHLMTGQMIIVK